MASKMVSFATLLSTCATLVLGVAAAGEQTQPSVGGEHLRGSVNPITLVKSQSNNFLYSTVSQKELRSKCILFLFDEMEAKKLAADSTLRSDYMNLFAGDEAKTEKIREQCIGAIDFAKDRDRGRGAEYDRFKEFVDRETDHFGDVWKREPTFKEIAYANRSDSSNVFKDGFSAPMMRMIVTMQAAEAASHAEDISTRLVLELQAKLYFLQKLMTATPTGRTEHEMPYYTKLTADELREICIQSVFDVLKQELKTSSDEIDQIHEKYIVDLRENRPADKSKAYEECLGAFGQVKSMKDLQFVDLAKIQGEIYLDAYALVDSCDKYPSKEDYKNPTDDKVKRCLGRRTPGKAKAAIALRLARLVAYPKDRVADLNNIVTEPEKEDHEIDSELLGLFNFIDKKSLSGDALKYDPEPYYKTFKK